MLQFPPGARVLLNNAVINNYIHEASPPGQSAWSILCDHIAGDAVHNADDLEDNRCLAGTRVSLLSRLKRWAESASSAATLEDSAINAEPPITWLHGPAGSGKTAIAKSLAEDSGLGLLVASFFFWRTSPERSNEMRLVPTLAYQLAQSLSGLRPLIEDQVTQDPAIFKKSPMMQLEHLILRPISRLLPNLRNALTLRNDNKPFGPCLIVIDALDECGGLHSRDNQIIAQKRVLEVLQELAEHHHKVYPFRILILSRTEQHLRRCFLDPGLQRVSSEILLDDSQLPDNDIVFYTAHEFMLITEKHPDRHSLPKHWPGREIIGWIARNASGQFIYAVTVMRFIRSPRHRPVERLQAILDQAQYRTESLSPLARLDDMYRQILSYSPNMQMTKRILAFQLIQELKASHSKALMTLEGVERGLDISPGSIRHALGDLEPLLFIHGISDTSSKFDIHFHHASFVDFLTNSYRSHEWYTDLAIFAQEFLHISLKALDDCEGDIQYSWFCIFCALLSSQLVTPQIQVSLETTWYRLPSYDAGRQLLRYVEFSKGSCLGDYYDLVEAFVQLRKRPDHHLPSFTVTLKQSLQPYLDTYRSDHRLYALLLVICHAKARNTERSVLGARLQSTIRNTPHLAAVDRSSLSLAEAISHPDSPWITRIIPAVFGELAKPNDDPVLTESVVVLLEVIVGLTEEEITDEECNRTSILMKTLLNVVTPCFQITKLLSDAEFPTRMQHYFDIGDVTSRYLSKRDASLKNRPASPSTRKHKVLQLEYWPQNPNPIKPIQSEPLGSLFGDPIDDHFAHGERPASEIIKTMNRQTLKAPVLRLQKMEFQKPPVLSISRESSTTESTSSALWSDISSSTLLTSPDESDHADDNILEGHRHTLDKGPQETTSTLSLPMQGAVQLGGGWQDRMSPVFTIAKTSTARLAPPLDSDSHRRRTYHSSDAPAYASRHDSSSDNHGSGVGSYNDGKKPTFKRDNTMHWVADFRSHYVLSSSVVFAMLIFSFFFPFRYLCTTLVFLSPLAAIVGVYYVLNQVIR